MEPTMHPEIQIHKAGNGEALINWYNNGANGQINWGSEGDFDDCVAIAGKYLDNPQGFCQLRHIDATGAPAGKAGSEIAKGGPGSGAQAGHPFEGNQWTKTGEGERTFTDENGNEYKIMADKGLLSDGKYGNDDRIGMEVRNKDGVIIGQAKAHYDWGDKNIAGPVVKIWHIQTDEKVRGQGIARKMVDAMRNQIKMMGDKPLILHGGFASQAGKNFAESLDPKYNRVMGFEDTVWRKPNKVFITKSTSNPDYTKLISVRKGGPGSGRHRESLGKIDPHVDSYDAMVPLVDKLGVAIEGEDFDRDSMEPEDSEQVAPELKQKVAENIAARMGDKWADRLATACPRFYLLEQGFIAGDFDVVPQVYFDHDSLYTFRSIGDEGFEAPYLLKESDADQAVENGTEVVHGDDPRIKQRLAELGASALVSLWAIGSNETTKNLAIQKAAAEEFGLKETAEWQGEDGDKVDDEYSKNGDLYRAFLRAQYDETQDYLAKNGITQVPLYRGMEFFEDEFNEITGAGGFPEIATRPLSSFSYDSIVAQKFADGTFSTQGSDYKGMVLSGVAPASRVFSCAETGLGCYSEREIVLLGGRDKWNYETVAE